MQRHGELTSKQLVTIILVIVSFTVILIFFFTLNLRSDVDKEACRNSVVLRGTAPFGKSVELNCETEDICISKGGKCTEVSGNDARTIKVKDKNELLTELGQLMYDCWWQTGSGEVDYLQGHAGGVRKYCFICNRIYFDSATQRDIGSFTLRELYNNLHDQPSPDGTSMLFALHKTQSVDAVLQANAVDGTSLQQLYNAPLKLNQAGGYALITGMSKTGWGAVLGLVGGGAVIGLTVVGTGGAAIPAWIAALSGAGIGGGLAWITQGPGDTQVIPPSLLSFNEEGLEQLGCYEVVSKD